MKRILTSTIFLALAAIATPSAFAQQTQIKPGLWQVDMSTDSGAQSSEFGNSIQQLVESRMTPEERKEIAEATARLAAKGVQIKGNAIISRKKECITKEQIAKFDVPGEEAPKSCSMQKSPRPDGVDLSMACTYPEVTTTVDMRMTYRGEKAFDIESASTMPGIDGQPMTLKGRGAGKWLSSDCGDVEPRTVSR